MSVRRFALLFVGSSLLLVGGYACSDDDTPPGKADAGVDSSTPQNDANPVPPPPPEEDATVPENDGGADADAILGCFGNPLVEDGGSPDASLDPARARALNTGAFLYGPRWIDDFGGQIIYSEVFLQRIVRSDGDGGAPTTIGPTPAASELPLQNATKNGFVYTAVATNPGPGGSILRTALDGGAAAATFAIPDASGVQSPNGIALSSKGVLYFTDPHFQTAGNPPTGIYRMPETGGDVTPLTTFAATGEQPVGIAFNKDESSLFVAYFGPGGKRIQKYAVDAAGIASAPVDLPFVPTHRPLGIAIDEAGNIWIAEQELTGAGGLVEVIDATGTIKWASIAFPDAHPTGIAFGGPDRTKVYVTTERGTTPGTLYVMDTRCKGF